MRSRQTETRYISGRYSKEVKSGKYGDPNRFEVTGEAIREDIRRNLAQGSSLLEAACGGNPILLSLAANRDYNILFTDLSEVQLAQIKDRPEVQSGNVRLENADYRHLPVEDDSIDTVVIQNATYEVPALEQREVFREIYRVLKKGGKFYLHTFVFGMPFDGEGETLSAILDTARDSENRRSHLQSNSDYSDANIVTGQFLRNWIQAKDRLSGNSSQAENRYFDDLIGYHRLGELTGFKMEERGYFLARFKPSSFSGEAGDFNDEIFQRLNQAASDEFSRNPALREHLHARKVTIGLPNRTTAQEWEFDAPMMLLVYTKPQ